jgi:hypothetical protein
MFFQAPRGHGPAPPGNDQPNEESAHLRAKVRRRAERRDTAIMWGMIAVLLAVLTAALLVVWAILV